MWHVHTSCPSRYYDTKIWKSRIRTKMFDFVSNKTPTGGYKVSIIGMSCSCIHIQTAHTIGLTAEAEY